MTNYTKIKGNCVNKKLVIVSKTRSKNEVMHFYTLGERLFGENRCDELLEKIELAPDIQWHFIGHLQRNKVRSILPYISCIQSVESLDLVKVIDREAKKLNKIVSIFIQINFAQEQTKKGISAHSSVSFIEHCLSYDNIRVNGILCMGPHTDDTHKIEHVFAEAHTHFLYLQQIFGSNVIQELSMGMSSDYLLALQHGSTMLRIGSILFDDKEEKSNLI